jgi:hypothetical protein
MFVFFYIYGFQSFADDGLREFDDILDDEEESLIKI